MGRLPDWHNVHKVQGVPVHSGYIVQRCAPRIKEVAKCKTMFRKLPSLYKIPTLVWPSVPKLIISIDNCFSFHFIYYIIQLCIFTFAWEGGLRRTKKLLCLHEKVFVCVVFEDLNSNATKNCSVRFFLPISIYDGVHFKRLSIR